MATFTLDQYNKITEAIAQGALIVKYADKTVQYRSLDEMIRIRNMMAEDLGLNTNSGGKKVFADFSKGTR